MFVNHQFGDLVFSKDEGTRARHAAAIKQMSPQRDANASRSPQSQTAYEKWWYAQRDEIVKKLEGGAENGNSMSPSSNNNNNNSNSRGLQQEEQICKKCNGSIPRERSVGGGGQQNNSTEISPARAGGSNSNSISNARSPANNNNNNNSLSVTSTNKNEPSRVPGTDFVALHPSHLYLHHHDVVNHVHEDLIRHPGNAEARRSLEDEAKNSPSRHDPNMTAYEKWWYAERDRILQYVEEHKDGPK